MAVIGRAEGMVSQHFDDPAVGDLPACALHDHAFEFRFQRGQPREAALDLRQLCLGDGIGGLIGHDPQFGLRLGALRVG